MSDLLRKPTRRITLRVDAGVLTQPFLDRCQELGLREGELLRRLIAFELGQSAPAVKRRKKVSKVGSIDKTRVRKVIRFTESELEILEQGASNLGFSLPEYLVALARAHVGDAYIGRDERLALSSSNYQLSAVGRNLNQVAKVLNSGQPLGTGDFASIEEAVRAVKLHMKEVAGFLLSVRARWAIGDEKR